MVRIATLAVLFLSATVLARPTHKRRGVCKTNRPAATPTTLPAEIDDTKNVEIKPSSTKMVKVSTKSASPAKTPSAGDDETKNDDTKNDDTTNEDNEPSSGGGGGIISGGSGALAAVFPAGMGKSSWTVANVSGAKKAMALTSNTFPAEKEASTSDHPVVEHEGKIAWRADMVKGCLTPGSRPRCGFSLYTPGPRNTGVDLTKASEMTFSYSIFFDDGYDWNQGGKLPGLYGGIPSKAETCSGGHHDKGCWSARLMWRAGGNGELYLYLPPGVNSNDSKCGKSGKNKCAGDYGASAGRGTWKWETGKWQTISQRIKMNTPGKDDGEAEIYHNGKSVFLVKNITWKTTSEAVARGIQMQIFYGGHTDEWRARKSSRVHFADFSVAVLR